MNNRPAKPKTIENFIVQNDLFPVAILKKIIKELSTHFSPDLHLVKYFQAYLASAKTYHVTITLKQIILLIEQTLSKADFKTDFAYVIKLDRISETLRLAASTRHKINKLLNYQEHFSQNPNSYTQNEIDNINFLTTESVEAWEKANTLLKLTKANKLILTNVSIINRMFDDIPNAPQKQADFAAIHQRFEEKQKRNLAQETKQASEKITQLAQQAELSFPSRSRLFIQRILEDMSQIIDHEASIETTESTRLDIHQPKIRSQSQKQKIKALIAIEKGMKKELERAKSWHDIGRCLQTLLTSVPVKSRANLEALENFPYKLLTDHDRMERATALDCPHYQIMLLVRFYQTEILFHEQVARPMGRLAQEVKEYLLSLRINVIDSHSSLQKLRYFFSRHKLFSDKLFFKKLNLCLNGLHKDSQKVKKPRTEFFDDEIIDDSLQTIHNFFCRARDIKADQERNILCDKYVNRKRLDQDFRAGPLPDISLAATAEACPKPADEKGIRADCVSHMPGFFSSAKLRQIDPVIKYNADATSAPSGTSGVLFGSRGSLGEPSSAHRPPILKPTNSSPH